MHNKSRKLGRGGPCSMNYFISCLVFFSYLFNSVVVKATAVYPEINAVSDCVAIISKHLMEPASQKGKEAKLLHQKPKPLLVSSFGSMSEVTVSLPLHISFCMIIFQKYNQNNCPGSKR